MVIPADLVAGASSTSPSFERSGSSTVALSTSSSPGGRSAARSAPASATTSGDATEGGFSPPSIDCTAFSADMQPTLRGSARRVGLVDLHLRNGGGNRVLGHVHRG